MHKAFNYPRRLARAICLVLCCCAGLLILTPLIALAQLDQTERNQARREFLIRQRCSSALGDIIRARAELGAYDLLLETLPADKRDPQMIYQLNAMRWSILRKATSAFFLAGPIAIPTADREVYAALCSASTQMGHEAMPATLSEVVTYGYIPHLPDSPYAGGEWLRAAPATDPPPGSVLYLAWAPKNLAFHFEPALECYLLVLFDQPGNERNYSLESAKENYIGDLTVTMPYFPANVLEIGGQDYDTGG